ncbi:MAG: DNA repair protein RadC [Patescibacteria group bacterium]
MPNSKNASGYVLHDNDLIMDNEDKKYHLSIRDMADEDRPRERLIKYGAESLSTEELLTVVLNTGTRKEEVMHMVKRIIKEYGEKNIGNPFKIESFAKEADIPTVKACQIAACFEIGRRFFKETPGRQASIRTAKQAYEYLKDMRDLSKEQLRGLYLNSRYRLIHDEIISVGSLTANIVHPREVYKPAFEYSAAAVIIAHNHPSGSLKPTQSDIETTRQLREAGKIIGVDLLDHIIIAGNKFFSIPLD